MPDAFGNLLKEWRGRRRMSQLELALMADVSARHISFLETGRSRPSRPMVLRLSESLEVPRATRNRLLSSAGFASAYRERRLDDDELQFVRDAMDWTLERHAPYPALAFDRHWRIVRMNRVSAALLESMGLDVGDSLLDAFIDGGPFTEALENRDEIARHLVTRLRTESLHVGGDVVLDQAADRIAVTLDDTALPPGTMPAIIPARYRTHGVVLSFFTTISQFGSTEDIALAELKIEQMFPADEFTRECLLQQFGDPAGNVIAGNGS